jgi:hypothetical protein
MTPLQLHVRSSAACAAQLEAVYTARSASGEGPEAARLAVECAARNNIEVVLEELTRVRL